MVRMNSHAQGQIAAVRQAIRALDPNVPVDRIGTMADAMSESVSLSRFRSLLMTAFAATALLLAAIGIYGVVAYAVAKRTKEIGLRMALGATPSGVVAMVVSQASRPVVAGIAGGLIGAFLLTRVAGNHALRRDGLGSDDVRGCSCCVECGGHGGVLRPRLAGVAHRSDGGPAQ